MLELYHKSLFIIMYSSLSISYTLAVRRKAVIERSVNQSRLLAPKSVSGYRIIFVTIATEKLTDMNFALLN